MPVLRADALRQQGVPISAARLLCARRRGAPRETSLDVLASAEAPLETLPGSPKGRRSQQAQAARHLAQKIAGLSTLYALNKALAVAVADAGIHAPSALIGVPHPVSACRTGVRCLCTVSAERAAEEAAGSPATLA